jgi:hypothetical protein
MKAQRRGQSDAAEPAADDGNPSRRADPFVRGLNGFVM